MLIYNSETREIPADLFAIEFRHHMRRYCGYSLGYQDDLIGCYCKKTDIDRFHVEQVLQDMEPPSDDILAAMGAERIIKQQEGYRYK